MCLEDEDELAEYTGIFTVLLYLIISAFGLWGYCFICKVTSSLWKTPTTKMTTIILESPTENNDVIESILTAGSLRKNNSINGNQGTGLKKTARERSRERSRERNNNIVKDKWNTSNGVHRPPRLKLIPKSLEIKVIEPSEGLIVGMPSAVTIVVHGDHGLINEELVSRIKIETCERNSAKDISYDGKIDYHNCRMRFVIKFLPLMIGELKLVLKPTKNGIKDQQFSVNIQGNNPLVSFSEGSDWPVAVAVCKQSTTIYVAYVHHVAKFTTDGDFRIELLKDNKVYFNDICVNDNAYFAVSVSKWTKETHREYRTPEVRLYSPNALLLWKTDWDFAVSILHISFHIDGDVMVAARKALCKCAFDTGNMTQQVEMGSLEFTSRLATSSSGHIFILDGTKGRVHVLDKELIPDGSFKLRMEFEDTTHGFSGLAVDDNNMVFVSHCLEEKIQIYSIDGQILGFIESEWDYVRWPLALAIYGTQNLIVADHGHGCLKKFKYNMLPKDNNKDADNKIFKMKRKCKSSHR